MKNQALHWHLNKTTMCNYVNSFSITTTQGWVICTEVYGVCWYTPEAEARWLQVWGQLGLQSRKEVCLVHTSEAERTPSGGSIIQSFQKVLGGKDHLVRQKARVCVCGAVSFLWPPSCFDLRILYVRTLYLHLFHVLSSSPLFPQLFPLELMISSLY